MSYIQFTISWDSLSLIDIHKLRSDLSYEIRTGHLALFLHAEYLGYLSAFVVRGMVRGDE
jgi:hypothetical protein